MASIKRFLGLVVLPVGMVLTVAAVMSLQGSSIQSVGCLVGASFAPCVVAGPNASGAVSTQNPVQIAGNDGTDVRSISTDAAGETIPANASTANADAISNTNSSPTGASAAVLYRRTLGYLFNGATYDRARSASATNLTTSPNVGELTYEKGARWTVASNSGAGSLGSASKAAGAAGVRHVVDCISFSASVAGSAPTATTLRFDIRDGASGAGTVIWSFAIEIPATTTFQSVIPHSVCGLNFIGSAATAMTAEYSTSIANVSEAANISGYDVQ